MGRASRAAAEQHHDELIKAAARLFRERDLGAVSVPDVMSAIGLTRGGFYKHFDSKDALVAAAVGQAFDEHADRIAQIASEHDADPALTRQSFIDFCLSPDHRDDPGTGCPTALASGISRCEAGGAPRAAYIDGVRVLLRELTELFGAGGDDADVRADVLADLATVAGALLLSRATAGDPISDEVLAAARRRLRTPQSAE